MNIKELKIVVLEVFDSFPKSKKDEPFLTLKNKRRLYFNIFIKKYGIDGSSTKYSDSDIARRIRLVECFDFFTKQFDVKYQRTEKNKNYYILETKFYKLVFLEKRNKKLECISFYPK